MFNLPCPKRFLRLSTAMLAMVTYRCMLPPKTGGREKQNTNNTLSGLRVVRLKRFFLCFVFCATLGAAAPNAPAPLPYPAMVEEGGVNPALAAARDSRPPLLPPPHPSVPLLPIGPPPVSPPPSASSPPAPFPLPPPARSLLLSSLPFLSPPHPQHMRLAPASRLRWAHLESLPMRQL